MKKQSLPHFSKRKTPIYMLLIHCSAQDTNDMIKLLDEHKLSVHYIIGLDGTITQTVDDYDLAYHAGISYWRGHESLNHCSIGVEVSNLSLGQKAYNQKQINAMIELFSDIIRKLDIKQRNIVGHSDVAPTRKPDPGIAFPWEELAKNGIGIWYDIDDAKKMAEKDVAKLLEIIGYDIRTKEAVIASSYAFRRRFLPEEVSIDDNIMHLVNNVYPIGEKELLKGEKFLQTLRAVAYKYMNT